MSDSNWSKSNWLESYPNVERLLGYNPDGCRIHIVAKDLETKLGELFAEVEDMETKLDKIADVLPCDLNDILEDK